jgi:hypothetical protein
MLLLGKGKEGDRLIEFVIQFWINLLRHEDGAFKLRSRPPQPTPPERRRKEDLGENYQCFLLLYTKRASMPFEI